MEMKNKLGHPEMALEDIAIVGMGCILPDALDVSSFWENVQQGTYSIREVPPEQWNISEYYHPDAKVPDKSYSKIGAFVQGFQVSGLEFRIPPKVWEAMDNVQKWTLVATREALRDSGYLDKPFAREKTAVILGNAMGGQLRLKTALGVFYPEMQRAVKKMPEFQKLSGL